MSQAGHGRGLADSRSGLFWDMLRIVGELQQLQQVPPAYLFENVVAVDSPSPTVREDWGTIVGILGEPVVSDNAGLGGNTHRLRAFWTNIAGQGSTQVVMQHIASHIELPPVDVVLPSQLTAQYVEHDDQAPYAPVNKAGAPMRALPTLVSYQGSQAYRDRGKGLVWERATGLLVQPPAGFRELSMGFAEGASAAPGLLEVERWSLIGQAMSAWQVGYTLLAAQGVRRVQRVALPVHAATAQAQSDTSPPTGAAPAGVPKAERAGGRGQGWSYTWRQVW
eukprot:jgi/Mesvir1/17751/Mv12102-RA.1